MDEPTSVLTPQEVEDLFVTLRRLADEGMAILYISHKLNEIKALCSEATILRGGKRIATAIPDNETTQSLAALMMGDEISEPVALQRSAQDATLLALAKLNLPIAGQHGVRLIDINLTVNAGEIVGIAGVAGNGQDELMQVIAGEVRLKNKDCLKIAGKPSGDLAPGARRKLGLCCVPEERLGHAAVPSMSLADNAMLTAHYRYSMSTGGLLSKRKSAAFANGVIDKFNVQCTGPNSLAQSLSGGNLQKFIVGREMQQAPDVLVVSQPTWGVDAGAAAAIHQALQDMASDGTAVLVISQDLDELMIITDRIAALCAGRLSQSYPTSQISVQQLGLLMGGATLQEGVA